MPAYAYMREKEAALATFSNVYPSKMNFMDTPAELVQR